MNLSLDWYGVISFESLLLLEKNILDIVDQEI